MRRCEVRETRSMQAALAENLLLLCVAVVVALLFPRTAGTNALQPSQPEEIPAPTYLGFDANDYPGDEALPGLRRTFSFSGYWLNVPPGAKTNSWIGKRAELLKNGFGFLVLFNGRLSSELRPPVDPSDLGARDAELAVAAAQREGFSADRFTVIYLDIEEGGRMLSAQISYIRGWESGVESKGFVAGVYCSGMKVKEGKGHTITTADDIHERAAVKAYFIYNDECPPSPGCAYLKNPPEPSQSGFAGARVWQFAQSPRRRNLTVRCATTYSSDGNCHPPVATAAGHILLDLNSSVSPDPSAFVPGPAR
jgi:Domain of unknown function (DUF1906)